MPSLVAMEQEFFEAWDQVPVDRNLPKEEQERQQVLNTLNTLGPSHFKAYAALVLGDYREKYGGAARSSRPRSPVPMTPRPGDSAGSEDARLPEELEHAGSSARATRASASEVSGRSSAGCGARAAWGQAKAPAEGYSLALALNTASRPARQWTTAQPVRRAAARSSVDPETQWYRCAGFGCPYRAHSDTDEFGAWCCRKCFVCHCYKGGKKNSSGPKHGEKCEKIWSQATDLPPLYFGDFPPTQDKDGYWWNSAQYPINLHPELAKVAERFGFEDFEFRRSGT